jgi:hypothetical protein
MGAGDAHGTGRPYDLCVIHATTPPFLSDARLAGGLMERYPGVRIGLVGARRDRSFPGLAIRFVGLPMPRRGRSMRAGCPRRSSPR